MTRSTFGSSVLAAAAFSAVLVAQAAPPLSGDYAFGMVSANYAGSCTPSGNSFASFLGTLTFAPTGTFTWSQAKHEVCPLAVVTDSTQSGSGSWSLSATGLLSLDFNPVQPATNTAVFHLRPDLSMGVFGGSAASQGNRLGVMIKRGSGLTNAALNGNYHLARLLFGNDTTRQLCEVRWGFRNFASTAGVYSEGGNVHWVYPGGSDDTNWSVPTAPYAVVANGALTAWYEQGAVSPDGACFFHIGAGGAEASLSFGFREGTTCTDATFAGSSGMVGLGAEYGNNSCTPIAVRFGSESGTATLTPATATFGYGTTELSTDCGGSALNALNGAGSYSIAASGYASFTVTGQPPVNAAFDERGTMGYLVPFGSSTTELMLFVHRGTMPANFGTATAGLGGQLPTLTGFGGFPLLGNTAFGVTIASGRGAAPAVLAMSLGLTAGVPVFGGTLWVDPSPAQLLGMVFPLPLFGLPNVAGAGWYPLPLPLPNQPSLDGVNIYLQAAVEDVAAPQGYAFTPGLRVLLVR